jgi:hypothetical protein
LSSIRQVAIIVFAVLVAIWCLPEFPGGSATGVDPSWVLGVNSAAGREKFGSGVIFTYGPLAEWMVATPIFGSRAGSLGFWACWVASLSVAFAYIYKTWCQAPRDHLTQNWSFFLRSATLLFPLSLVAMLTAADARVVNHLVALQIALALAAVQGPTWLLLLLSIWVGLALSIKISSFLIGLAILGIVLGLHPKKIPLVAFLLSTSAVVFFGFGNGGWGQLGSYLGWSVEVLRGYPEAMAFTDGNIAHKPWIALALLACTLLLGFWQARVWWLVAPALFLVIKLGSVRLDPEHFQPVGYFAAALCGVPFIAESFSKKTVSSANKWCAFSVALSFLLLANPWRFRPFDQQWLNPIHSWKLAEMKQRAILSRITIPGFRHTPLEVIPWETDLALATTDRWSHRPVFQTYQAYSPELDQINLDWLRQADPTQRILAGLITIDGRHPMWDEPLSWRHLLRSWRATQIIGGHVMLEPGTPTQSARTTLLKQAVRLEEVLQTPEHQGRLYVKADLKFSLLGRLLSLLLRPAIVHAEIRSLDGSVQRIRTVPRQLESGVLLNPLPKTPAELKQLFDGASRIQGTLPVLVTLPVLGTLPGRTTNIRFTTDQAFAIHAIELEFWQER